MRKEGVATVWSSPGRRDGWSLDGGKLILTRTRRSPVAAEINAGRRPVPHSTNKKIPIKFKLTRFKSLINNLTIWSIFHLNEELFFN